MLKRMTATLKRRAEDKNRPNFETAAAGSESPTRRLPGRRLWAIALGGALVYTLVLTSFAIAQHLGLKTQMNDLGNFDQALWSAAQGDWRMTVSNNADGVLRSRIGGHANLILLPLSTVYLIFDSPILLLVLTSVACGAAGLGLFALARHKLGDTPWALVPAAAFWLSPIVHDSNLYDFHIITVATAFLVWMVWAFEVGRVPLGFGLLGAAMLCKEDIPLITAMFGLFLLLTERRQLGVWVLGLSIGYFLLLSNVIVPFFDGAADLAGFSSPSSRYRWLGSGMTGIIGGALSKPGLVISHVFAPMRFRIVLYLLLGGGLAAIRAWRIGLLLVPPLAMALLAEGGWISRVTGTYYWITAEAVIVMGCVFAAADKWPAEHRRVAPWPLVYLGGASVVLSLLFSPLPHGLWATWAHYEVTDARERLISIGSQIPPSSKLCVQNNLGPHLAHRSFVTSQPESCDQADYAIFHLRALGGPDSGLFVRSAARINGGPKLLAHLVTDFLRRPDWGLVARQDRFYLFARGAPPFESPEESAAALRDDLLRFRTELADARRHRSILSHYLVGKASATRR